MFSSRGCVSPPCQGRAAGSLEGSVGGTPCSPASSSHTPSAHGAADTHRLLWVYSTALILLHTPLGNRCFILGDK